MAEIDGQTTDRLSEDTRPEVPRVLYRESFQLEPTVVYSAGKMSTYVVDISSLNIEDNVPEVVLWRGGSLSQTGGYSKCPYFLMDSSGNISEFVTVSLSTGSAKSATDNATRITIKYYSRAGTVYYFYLQVLSLQVADRDLSIFPYQGSYTT